MTIPVEPQPPETVGTQPRNASEVNGLVGSHLREFLVSKARINQDHEFFAVTDLKAAPYYFSDTQEALLKSAIADLDTALDAVDLAFISQIVGM
jgi:hypothetical protein